MMGRKRRTQSYGGFAPQPQLSIPAHPILGPVVYLMILCVMVVVIILYVGPVLDYFSVYLASMPNESAGYVNPTLQLFPWAYVFLKVVLVVGGIGAFAAVIRQLYYSRYGDD